MKNKNIVSGVVGAGFFAIGYLGLSLALAPALAIGAVAFGASELVISSNKKIQEKLEPTFKERISLARKQIVYLKEMVNKIDDEGVSKDLEEITKSANKIINRIEESQLENKSAVKFMDYYLPVCVKIVDRYDEIENQKLTSHDSKKFMTDSKKIINDTNKAFKKILNSLYQSDILNADAEMKVYNSILKADGYENEIELEDGEDDE